MLSLAHCQVLDFDGDSALRAFRAAAASQLHGLLLPPHLRQRHHVQVCGEHIE